MAIVLGGPMINPLYERLSDEEWEAAWSCRCPKPGGQAGADDRDARVRCRSEIWDRLQAVSA